MKRWMSVAAVLLVVACGQNKKQDAMSFVGNWIEVMPDNPQIIQGVTLNADGTASSIGMATLLYESWALDDERLILNGKSVGNGQTIDFSDTLNIVRHTADSLVVGKNEMYRRAYFRTADVEALKGANVLDSLQVCPDAGAVVKEVYEGTLPAASCPGIEYTITIHHYENSGDGVFHASLNYLEAENGQDRRFDIYGRQYTLRGDAADENATVIQLKSFDGKETLNFRKLDNQLQMLDTELNPIDSELNYTLEQVAEKE